MEKEREGKRGVKRSISAAAAQVHIDCHGTVSLVQRDGGKEGRSATVQFRS